MTIKEKLKKNVFLCDFVKIKKKKKNEYELGYQNLREKTAFL